MEQPMLYRYETVDSTNTVCKTLAQQGAFDLGYYHQTQKRYTKKEEKENV